MFLRSKHVMPRADNFNGPMTKSKMTPSERQLYQQMGALQAEVKQLKGQYREIDSKLDTLLERSARDRGSRASLWRVGVISAGFASLGATLLQWWTSYKK